jgi:GNAT superfamily N-acetyltransferase
MTRSARDGKLECTVTYLEMRAPPKLPPLVPPTDSRLKLAPLRAERPTVSFYRYLYEAVGRPWKWKDRIALNDEELATIVQDDEVEIYVLYANGVPAGYAELDLRRRPEVNLAYFGLLPEFIGQGLGAYFLNWTVRRAWKHGPSRFTVNTNNFDHPRALPLYQKMGFVSLARRTVWIDPELAPSHRTRPSRSSHWHGPAGDDMMTNLRPMQQGLHTTLIYDKNREVGP